MIDLPRQPAGVAWPDREWPVGPAPHGLDGLLDLAFADPQPAAMGVSLAAVVIAGGRLVAERYGPETGPDTTLISWSTAKSITHALAGFAVGRGNLDVFAPAGVREWQGRDDPRAGITVDQLLRMSDGLAFVEDYVDDRISDVIQMLFGDGQHDVAAFAAGRPLGAPPDTVWNYSSGSTNIVARVLGVTETSIRRDLFDPLGMSSASARFDDAGTFVGSSFVYATARDFARFALLYLRGGYWRDRMLLPEGWVDYGRTPTATCDTGEYGAHWWLEPGSPLGIFLAKGYEGQYFMCVPALDLIVVRLGKTVAELRPNVEAWMHDIVDLFAGA